MTKRRWWWSSLAAAGVVAAVVLLVLRLTAGGTHAGAPTPSRELGADGVKASWVTVENRKPGSPNWRITGAPPTGRIEGFADRTYAAAGDQVALRVSSTAPSFHVEAYRVGYYNGTGARLVWQSAQSPGHVQPACPVTSGINLVSCANWAPSLNVPITGDFVPGDYLLKLVGDDNEQSYVPLTVWDPGSHAAYVVKNDVFTWQAWNPYGGYDYYVGQGSCPSGVYPLCSRARVVSYDRPYGDGDGTGDFLWLEAPLVRFVEQHGLDVTYATDLTVAEHPGYLDQHRALLSLGHDECWSLAERNAAVSAEGHGLNLAFFGASGVLRHVRSQPSPLGGDRELVDYRDSAADPLNGKGNPLEVTGNTWASSPANWPEDDFVGENYNGFLEPGVHSVLTVADDSAWIFAGTGLHNGSALPAVIASDVDSLEPGQGHPAGVQVLAHSALPAGQAQARSRAGGVFYSDMTYYTDPASHAGIWDSGTNNWIPALEPGSGETPGTAAKVQAITANLCWLLGQGPAGTLRPATPNWHDFYPGSPPAPHAIR